MLSRFQMKCNHMDVTSPQCFGQQPVPALRGNKKVCSHKIVWIALSPLTVWEATLSILHNTNSIVWEKENKREQRENKENKSLNWRHKTWPDGVNAGRDGQWHDVNYCSVTQFPFSLFFKCICDSFQYFYINRTLVLLVVNAACGRWLSIQQAPGTWCASNELNGECRHHREDQCRPAAISTSATPSLCTGPLVNVGLQLTGNHSSVCAAPLPSSSFSSVLVSVWRFVHIAVRTTEKMIQTPLASIQDVAPVMCGQGR